MVSFNRFNKMPIDEKAWYIWNGATFIMAREDKKYRFNLFHLNEFYIELVYSFSENDICRIRAFFSVTFLKDYLNEISLGTLLEQSSDDKD